MKLSKLLILYPPFFYQALINDAVAKKAVVLDWKELVPGNISVKKMEKLMSKAAVFDDMDSVFFEPKYFPAVKKLNGKLVQILGYVVPLDFDAKKISEFLLVPYMGPVPMHHRRRPTRLSMSR